MAKPAASSSFSNLFLLFFGSGTFALPWGFVHGGLLGGTLGVFAVAFLTYLTISMLVVAKRCQQRRLSMLHADATKAAKTAQELQQSLSYASITTLAFGTPHAGLLVKAATTLSSLGACAGYLTFVCGLLTPLIRRLQRLQGDDDDYTGDDDDSIGTAKAATTTSSRTFLSVLAGMDEQALLTCLMPVLVPLTWVRSFRDLACTSTVGNVVFVLAVGAVLQDGLSRFGPPTAADFAAQGGPLRLWPSSASSYALFVAPCIYLFTVHYCALPIEAEGPTVVSTAIRDSASASTAVTNDSSSGGGGVGGGGAVKAPSEKTPLVDDAQQRQGGGCCGGGSGGGSNGGEGDFGSSLLQALLASAVLNALVGGAAYVTYARSKHAPRDPISGSTVTGCDEIICDDVIKNVDPSNPSTVLISVSLMLNLALTYVLMLAPSRQYLEAALLAWLAATWPATFAPQPTAEQQERRRQRRQQQQQRQQRQQRHELWRVGAVSGGSSGGGGGGGGGFGDVELLETGKPATNIDNGTDDYGDYDDNDAHSDDGGGGLGGAEGAGGGEDGRWAPGSDNWARAWVRNALRTGLVLLTAQLAVAVPHFALLSGFVGGMTDTLQSLVLPPLVYLAETRRRRLRTMAALSSSSSSSSRSSRARRWRQPLELFFCSALAAAGAVFIVFATTSNVKAIIAFVDQQKSLE